MDRQRRQAWAYLSRVADGPNSTILESLAVCGPVETAEKVERGEVWLAHLAGATTWARSDSDLDLIEQLGGRLVTPDDDEWPTEALAALAGTPGGALPAQPIALWVLGQRRLDQVTGAAVVTLDGAVAATDYGCQVAAGLASDLLRRGWGVLTPAHRGIGSAVLEAALTGPPAGEVAVLSNCGFQVLGPWSDTGRLQALLDRGGALITEYAPTSPTARSAAALVRRSAAPARLLAALSAGVVVVEPGAESHSLEVANHARTMGRFLGVAPGPATATSCLGSNLLRRGASKIRSSGDIVSALSAPGQRRSA